jgi:hypothetical protein
MFPPNLGLQASDLAVDLVSLPLIDSPWWYPFPNRRRYATGPAF